MRSQFPSQLTPFVGRTQELADVSARLANPDCRLLTLTGAGGSGKTRLAIEVAHAVEGQFPQGAVFVGLQPLGKSELLASTIADALDIALYGLETSREQLFQYLTDKSLLLVLDNFEHLLDVAPFVSDLLAHAAGVKVLVTSREALNLQEEWLYPLSGMSTPRSIYSETLEDYEAVRLFLYHARRVQPNFDFEENREAVIRICQIAEGLPLAIGLAASWLKALSTQRIAVEMQNNFDFLSTSARNVEERHRSMRAAFDQSWKLLTDDERLIFAKLSAFSGGFEQQAAEHVAGATLPILVTLVEKSLLNRQSDDRWDIHELLRQYGEEQLEALGILDSVRAAHSYYYADFMQRCIPALKSPTQLAVLNEIEIEFNNILGAWCWALVDDHEDVIDQILDSFYQFGFIRGRFRIVADLIQEALDAQLADQRLVGRLLARRWGYLHWLAQDDYQQPLADVQRALTIATANDDRFEIAFSMLMLGYVRINMEAYVEARGVLLESLDRFHELDEPYYECWVLHRIGYVYSNDGDIDAAVEWTERSLTLARSTPNLNGLGNTLYNLASIYFLAGNYSKGMRYFEEALEVVQSLRHHGQIAHTTALLSLAAFLSGDFAQTKRLAEEGWRIGEEIIAPVWQGYPLSLLILLNCMDENYAEATRLVQLAEARGSNTMGFQLYYWARSALAFGLDNAPGAYSFVREAFQLALRERSLAIEIALLPSAAFALSSTHPEQAVRLLAWLDHSPDSATLWGKQWPRVDRLRGDLQDQLSEAVFDREWERGAAMEWKAVLATLETEFQAVDPQAGMAINSPSVLDQLTARELDVLQLLATGLTNPQIAEQLVIGVGTVKTHTLNIYRKLDVANRSQAILRAQELGLLPS